MSRKQNDITDDEIRVILPKGQSADSQVGDSVVARPRARGGLLMHYVVIAAVTMVVVALCVGGALYVHYRYQKSGGNDYNQIYVVEEGNADGEGLVIQDMEGAEAAVGDGERGMAHVAWSDTVVGGARFTVLVPRNAVPRLQVGGAALHDSTAVLVVQAADVRRDNGQIVGAYVSEGELLSRGQSKSGFCAIINGNAVIGVADSTPYLEQAIESGGYFFRQYPLVVGGQVVENRLLSSSLRKALVELDGRVAVVLSHEKLTLNEFARKLAELGATNAIYLVGSSAAGFAVGENGSRLKFGIEYSTPPANVNYMVWR